MPFSSSIPIGAFYVVSFQAILREITGENKNSITNSKTIECILFPRHHAKHFTSIPTFDLIGQVL